jgi:16S rRNA processing protein RimM
MSSKLLMGRIGAAHGIKGEVRLQSFAQVPMDIVGYSPLETNRPGLTVAIETARDTGNGMLVVRLRDVADRAAAEKLNGVELFVDREKLPKAGDDDFYHADLVGLDARLSNGGSIGKVIAVPNFGAGDILEIRNPQSGDTYFYPFTKAVVPAVNVAEGFLVIEPPIEAEPGEEEPD